MYDIFKTGPYQGLLDTATLGAAPKIEGALAALILRSLDPNLANQENFGDTYERARNLARQNSQQIMSNDPLGSLLGGLLGGAALPFGTVNSARQALVSGAGYGAAYGLGSSDKGKLGQIDEENLRDAAASALLGGATGVTLQKGKKALDRLFQKKKIKLSPLQENAVQLSDKFKVPLTVGQASQNNTRLLAEDVLASGARGNQAAQIMENARNAQRESFRSAAENLRSNIGQGNFIEKGESLQPLVRNVIATANKEKQAINKAYDLAKSELNFLDRESIINFPDQAKATLLEEAITSANAPTAFAQLKTFKRIFDDSKYNTIPIQFKKLEAYRQGLNRAYKSNTGQERFAIKTIINEFDNYLDNTIQKALIEGDENVLNQFQNARKLAAEWKQKYTANDKGEFGKRFIQDIIENAQNSREPYTYGMISDKIFGANKYGFKNQAINIVKEIKNRVGADTPEFNGLKLDAVQKVIAPLLNESGNINFNNPAVQTYKNNLRQNENVLKEIFAPEELTQLKDFGDLASLLFQSRKSTINPSQSGIVTTLAQFPLVKQALGIASKVPFVKEIPNELSALQARQALNPNLRQALERINTSELPLPSSSVPTRGSLSANSLIESLSKSKEVDNNQPNFASKLNNLSLDELNALKVLKQKQKSLEDLSIDELEVLKQRLQSKPTNLVKRIGEVETNNNAFARNPNSSASGLLQFTDSTWREGVKRYGKLLGINMKDKNNPEAQQMIATRLLEDNAKELEKFIGRPPTQKELYITHFLGLGGTKKLLKAQANSVAARIFPTEARANREIFFKENGNPRTVKEVYEILTRKI